MLTTSNIVSRVCFLCNEKAEVIAAGGEHGGRWLVECLGDCPVYEISQQAVDELRDKPHERPEAIAIVKAVRAESPSDLSVIIVSERALRVTTRSSRVTRSRA